MVGPEDRACSSFCSELLRFLFFAPKLLLHPGAGRAQVVGHEGGRSRGADLVGHMRRELLDAAGDAAGDAAAPSLARSPSRFALVTSAPVPLLGHDEDVGDQPLEQPAPRVHE